MIAAMQKHLRPSEHALDTRKVRSKAKTRAKARKGKKQAKAKTRAKAAFFFWFFV